jgi:hypothetical protein
VSKIEGLYGLSGVLGKYSLPGVPVVLDKIGEFWDYSLIFIWEGYLEIFAGVIVKID